MRPRSVSQQKVADAICERIAAGESLRSICREAGMPSPSAVIHWTVKNTDFAAQYARACADRADVYFDRLDEVSDEAANAETAVQVAGLRLKADNIKWQLARMAPKKYGDKIEQTLQGPDGQGLRIEIVNYAAIPQEKP